MAIITVISEDALPGMRVAYAPPYSRRHSHLRKPPVLPSHTYRADGLLEVNPDAPHPIFDLMQRGEAIWDGKLKRSSKTFPELLSEYQRRYKRRPPLGFDHWSVVSLHVGYPILIVSSRWAYVKKHNVQLPDEYDQIYKDLEPFWGMDPQDLRRIQADWESHQDSYTLGKTGDDIAIVNYTLTNDNKNLLSGGYEIIDMLQDVRHLIPPFRAVFSPHDNPNLPVDHELRSQAIEAATRGKCNSESLVLLLLLITILIDIDINNLPPTKLDGWISSCPSTSVARRIPPDLTKPATPPSQKSFIYDHALSMDPCLHPTHLVQHGQFLSFGQGPIPHRTMVPQFSYSPSPLHQDIVTATPFNWVNDIYPRSADPEWEHKLDKRLLWRGANTGIWHATHTRWREAQRVRMVNWANDLNGTASVLKGPKSKWDKVGTAVEVAKDTINPGMLDVMFAGEPFSCEPEVCKELAEMFDWRKRQGSKDAGNYKYVLDVRCATFLFDGALIGFCARSMAMHGPVVLSA
jgi:hypothetical protein